MRKNLYRYASIVLAFGAALALLFQLAPNRVGQDAGRALLAQPAAPAGDPVLAFLHHLHAPLGALLLQIVVIVIASGVLGMIGERIGDAKILPVVTIAIVSLMGGAFLAMLAAMRVAAYRLSGARQGI